jgi:hypothetical protein
LVFHAMAYEKFFLYHLCSFWITHEIRF